MTARRSLAAACLAALLFVLLGGTLGSPMPPLVVGVEAVNPQEVDVTAPRTATATPSQDEKNSSENGAGTSDHSAPMRIVAYVGLACVIGIAALLVRDLLGERERTERHRVTARGENAAVIVDLDEVANDLERTVLRAQAHSDDLVVQAWKRLEQAGSASGVRRHATESTQEYTQRVLGSTTADPAAVERLGELYREVLYSSHERAAHQTEVARETVMTIVATLRRRS